MKIFEPVVYAKKACRIVLIVALCPLLTLAEAIPGETSTTPVEIETRSSPRPLPPDIHLSKEMGLNAGDFRLDATSARSDGSQREILSRSAGTRPDDSVKKSSRKKTLLAGLGIVLGGVAMNVLSHGSEPYTYVYCGNCRPPLSTTLYRDTTSSSLYWGGIAVAGAGTTMVVFSLFKKK